MAHSAKIALAWIALFQAKQAKRGASNKTTRADDNINDKPKAAVEDLEQTSTDQATPMNSSSSTSLTLTDVLDFGSLRPSEIDLIYDCPELVPLVMCSSASFDGQL